MHRIAARICCLGLLLALWSEPASAQTWAIKAKASGDQRLAPELDLIRRGGHHCRFRGINRRGKSLFRIPTENAKTVRSMAMSVDANDDDDDDGEPSRRLLLSYPKSGQKPSADTLKTAGLKLVQDYQQGSFLLVEPEDEVTAETVETLMGDEAVVHAAPDYIVKAPERLPSDVVQTAANASAATGPNDPLFKYLWGMTNIGATKVWPTISGAPNIIVAVIDTGVDYNHPDLKANMWTSRNGKHGYDFFDNDDDPMDEDIHGTHCAGTIAGVGNNGVGVAGVSWKAQIMAMRFLGADGSGATSDAVKCIDWAVANGAHILSNSWAGPDTSPELGEAIARAEQRGVLFVAAAGNTVGNGNNNDTSPYYPASLPNANIISVAAIDVNNQRGSFSHYGPRSVDIAAPGVNIVSTVPTDPKYGALDGTSMAAPHVSGAAALVWAATFPNAAQDRAQMTKVRDLIYANARPLTAFKAYWGNNAPARVPGGTLDISFLAQSTADPVPAPSKLRLIEFRMKVDPTKLR